MNAGRFDRQIEIQARTEARDTAGGPTYTWETFCIPWANIREGDGVETQQAGKKEAVISTVFTIRYRPDIRNSMRILHDEVYYYIEGISEVTRRSYLAITARAAKA